MLQAVARVWPSARQCFCLHLCGALAELGLFVQAEIAPGHPAVRTDPSKVQPWLRSLARLHAGVRRNRAKMVSETCLDRASVRCPGSLNVSSCSLNAQGSAAAVFWEDMDKYGEAQEEGVRMAHASPSGSLQPWHSSEPGVDVKTFSSTSSGWSASGRWFGLLHTELPGPSYGLTWCVYDAMERGWQPKRYITDHALYRALHSVAFCQSEKLAACAANHVPWPNDDEVPTTSVVIVSSPVLPGVAVVPAGESIVAMCWLPGSTSLLVVGPCSVARVHVDPSSLQASGQREMQLQWVEAQPALSYSRLDLVPGTHTAVLLGSRALPGTGVVEALLTLVDTARLRVLGSWWRRVEELVSDYAARCPSGQPRPGVSYTSVCCSWSAVAICVGERKQYALWATLVCRLERSRVGASLFTVRHMTGASFSSCGLLLCGTIAMKTVAVLDARSGCALARLSPRRICPGWSMTLWIETHSVVWTVAGRLHIQAEVLDPDTRVASQDRVQMLFCVCKFGG